MTFDVVVTEKVTLPVPLSFLEIQYHQDHPEKKEEYFYFPPHFML